MKEIGLAYEEERNILKRRVTLNIGQYVSQIHGLENDKIRNVLWAELDPGSKSIPEIQELLSVLNQRVVYGIFAISQKPAIMHLSNLWMISDDYSSGKLAFYYRAREREFLAMALSIEMYKAGQLSLENAAAEYLKQRDQISS